MKRHYKEMMIIALIMTALINIVVWGEEVISDNGSNPTNGEAVSDDNSVSSGNDNIFLPVEDPKDEHEDNEDQGDNNQIPDIVPIIESPSSGAGNSGAVNDSSYSDWLLYSVSVDTLKLQYFNQISQNILSINEVLNESTKTQRSIERKLSGINALNADYQARMLYYMARLAKLVSGNGAEMLGLSSPSMDEIKIALSLNDFYEVSEDMIEYEEVSDNSAEEPESVSGEDVESISPDQISIDSVSKADIEKLQEQNEQLHDDLKGIFIVNIFAVLFLALLTAGQLEQIIFRRIRG